jgi:RHS repeat-associated protein
VVNGGTITYSYYLNSLGKDTARLRNALGAELTYDANGNLTSGGYTWDLLNRLSAIGSIQYQYDYQNRRNRYTPVAGSGSPVRYVSWGANTVAERSADSARTNDYLFGPAIDEPLGRRAADGSTKYYLVDGLGSVVALTSPSAQIASAVTYDEWGNTSGADLFGYTGREWARPVSALWNYRRRYYRSDWGRFISEDPERFRVDVNFYRYVFNRPTSVVDPLGMNPGTGGIGGPGSAGPGQSLCCPNQVPKLTDAFTKVCKASKGGACQALLNKYGLTKCFANKCNEVMHFVCIPKGQDCGGCGGPCNNLADYSKTIYLQPLAGSGLCGSLANTIAHEMAHMCGIGPDVNDPVNNKKANDVGLGCGGQ